MRFLLWISLCVLILGPPAIATGDDPGQDSPIILNFQASHPNGSHISFKVVESSDDDDERARAKRFILHEAQSAVDAGEAIIALEVPAGADRVPDPIREVEQEILAKGGVVVVADGSTFNIEQAIERRRTQRLNCVYTVARIVGVGGAITKVIAMTYNVPLSVALPVGIGAALYPGFNQAVNKARQKWMLSKKFFGIDDFLQDGQPNSESVFYAKLAISSALFLGIIRALCYWNGLEGLDQMLSLRKLEGLAFTIFLSTTLEFCWQRYVGLKRHVKDLLEPGHHYRHQEWSDRLTALLSVIGSTAQAFSAEGWTIGHIAVGAIAVSGAVMLIKEFPKPDGFVARVRQDLARMMGCLFSMLRE